MSAAGWITAGPPHGRSLSALILLATASLALALAPTGASGAPSPAECPNAELQVEDDSTALPDCRAWELVSPVEKNGGSVSAPEAVLGGGVLQAAGAGGAVTFSSGSSFGPEARGAPPASQYVSRRGEAGWQTENVTASTLSGSYGADSQGVPYQLFSPALDQALMSDGGRCDGGEACPGSYSLRTGDGALEGSLAAPDLHFVGTDAGMTNLAFTTCAALTAAATEVASGAGAGCDPSAANLYLWHGGAPQLVNILPAATHGTPGAGLAAQSGAISTDGSRVYWTASGGDLYLHEAGQGRAVDLSGQAEFQIASADGQIAYFLEAGHLYRYSAQAEAATDLTPAGGVIGVLGASGDGASIYYATHSALLLWQGGAISQVATGVGAAAPTDYPPAAGTARVSADGSHLAFLSAASLTGYDNVDQTGGEPDSEVYLYEAAGGRLVCASCNPSGAPPHGPSMIPGAIANGSALGATRSYKPRDLSADGRRLFFDSSDRLSPLDANATEDVYEWEANGEGSCRRSGGCVFLISGGRSPQASEFIDASADGSDAFFLTPESLVPSDPGSVDLYDAREGGGYPLPEVPIPCEGDACQALPSLPEDPQPGTLVAGPPNPPPHFPKAHHTKPGHKKKHARNGHRRHHRKHARQGARGPVDGRGRR